MITVVAVGKLREKPYRAMADEYLKRLSRYGRYAELELPDLPEPANASPAEEAKLRDREGEAILRALRPGQYVVALTLEGQSMDSVAFSRRIDRLSVSGRSELAFVIGGSLGLSEAVRQRADEELCFGPMTFPHQLARVMLLEQLYRAAKISAGERYHK